MNKTHIIIDEGSNSPVALAVDFVTGDHETECNSDIDQFIAKCNPAWGWNEAKKREVFATVMAEVNPPAVVSVKGNKKETPAQA